MVLATLLLAALVAGTPESRPREATIVADLLEMLPNAQRSGTSTTHLVPSAVCGGERRPGMMQHPARTGARARVTYALRLPVAAHGERLLLAF